MKTYLYLSMSLLLSIILCLSCSTNSSNNDLLRVALCSTTPPYGYYDEQNNQLVGFDVDIANELAKRLNKKIQIETLNFNRILYSVISNKSDLGFGSFYITPERAKVVNYSDPYSTDSTKIALLDKYVNINTIDDLKKSDMKIVSRNGTVYAAILKDLGFNDSQIVICPEQEDLKIMLENSDKTAVATSYKRLGHINKLKNSKIKFLEPPIVPEQPCGILINKNNTQLLKEVNKALKAMKEDGTYEKIAIKWFGENPFKVKK